MFFNPLFISNTTTGANLNGSNPKKFGDTNYLFADIINVSNEKIAAKETSLEINEEYKSLFKGLKLVNVQSQSKNEQAQNNFLGNESELKAFLLNLIEFDNSSTEKPNNNKGKNGSDVSVIPEYVTQVLNLLYSGEKVALPVKNNGKEIFVEIAKIENDSVKEKLNSSPKAEANSQNTNANMPNVDFDTIVANISLSLKETFTSDKFQMSDEKVKAIANKLETKFSKLVSVNNGVLKPKQNILGNIINDIKKEFQLNNSETGELKNVIVSEFVKAINTSNGKNESQQTADVIKNNFVPLENLEQKLSLTPKETEVIKKAGLSKVNPEELKDKLQRMTSTNGFKEAASVLQKINNYLDTKTVTSETNIKIEKLSVQEIGKKLNLTPQENSLVNNLNVEEVNIDELQKYVKSEVVKNPKDEELKSLFNKLQNTKAINNTQQIVEKREEIPVAKRSEAKNGIVDKVKSGIKNIFTGGETEKSANVKTEYLFALTSKKSSDSILVDKDFNTNSKSSTLLEKSIYTTEESREIAKIKIVPIGDEAAKTGNSDVKKESYNSRGHKISFTNNTTVVNKENKNAGFNNSASYGNSENIFDKEDLVSKEVRSSSSKSLFEKELQKNSDSVNKTTDVSEKNFTSTAKTNHEEIKIQNTTLPKTSFIQNQVLTNNVNTISKVMKKVDVKNLNRELGRLIQQGEKKVVQFQLTPENLGKMEIKVEVINKIVSASIKVENEAAQQIIQSSLDGLKTTLNQSGVQYNSLNVSLSNSDEKNQKYFNNRKKKNNLTANMNVEGFDDTFVHKNLGYNNYDFIA